ncbi:DotU family type IV/VI secretion system protein [Lentibacter algarum]|uniref:ImcF-related family protein n=1 Tax=Lentibacter algarum TaxID=576131 RepID=UPI001C067458|nr:ImcF-related family protein [Lentibacter algarum]MBU2980575.1 DotU family type IV/VI secretion system protein [Lentibacter algarum]
MASSKAPPSVFDRAARPVLELFDNMERQARDGPAATADNAEAALAGFERDAARAGAAPNAIKPARYALAMLLDTRARGVAGLSLNTWSVLAQRQLFEGHDMPVARIREFRDTAARQGEAYADLERFLNDILSRAEARRHAHKRIDSGHWGLRLAGYLLVLTLGLIGYAGWLEHRFHQKLITAFDAEALTIGLDRPQEGAALVQRLDAMQAAAARVANAARRAPFRRILRLPFGDGEAHANATYRAAVQRHVPNAIAGGIEEVLATQGDGLILYDALRAWSVLVGDVTWGGAYLSGWLEDNGTLAGLDGLAKHVALLDAASPGLTAQDTAVMDQARGFAAEVPEPDRAWLELLRAERMRALPDWQPTQAIAALETVVLRRSGEPVEQGIAGLFTVAGWAEARDFAVGGAVQRARDLAPMITGQTLPTENNSPDLLMNRLHQETMATWKEWLADLRVRPFGQRETAIVVSGALAHPENPLTNLLGEVWLQVGGNDRGRSHAQQLTLAREFGAMIQYVEQGRMAEISRLFSQLNVALGAIDINASRGTQRLMSIQDRARSIAALQNAPRIVVQIAEDVLAQSALPEQGQSANPLTRGWQQQVFPLCRDTVGRYPFNDGGADASPADLAALLGPQGALSIFVRQTAAPFLETSESPWRWKPEARFAGTTPESAAFLERAMQISEGLFDAGGQLSFNLTLAALAERGQTMFAIGGAAQPVRATGAPAELNWPGPQPQVGVEVSFRESAESARILHTGPWGLMRLIDGLRLRQRDGGQRMLLDLRTESGRVFLEMRFDKKLNPVSVRSAMKGLTCPPTL